MDKRYPYQGSEEKKMLGFEQTVKNIMSYQNDILVKKTQQKAKDYRCYSYSNRDGETVIYTCTVDWGGNTIPGTAKLYPKEMGKVMPSLDAITSMMNFFTHHTHHYFAASYKRSGEQL